MSKHHKSRAANTSPRQSGSAALLPILGAVFAAFLVIGMGMPVLPLHVHQGLDFGTFLVGLVTGSQFAAAILSRVWAGRQADTRGPKIAMIAGLAIAAAAGGLYLLSLTTLSRPTVSLAVLLVGRALLGIGESFIIIGGQSWALAILTARNTSKSDCMGRQRDVRGIRGRRAHRQRALWAFRLCRSCCDNRAAPAPHAA
jgi:MFS family permease